MKATDIKLNEAYHFEPRDAWPPLPPRLRRREQATGTVIEKGVVLRGGRKGAVKIRLSEDTLAQAREEQSDFEGADVTVATKDVTESVADREQRLAQEAREQAEHEADEKARMIRMGEMANAEALGYVISSIMYRPAEPAFDLADSLDHLIERAAKIRDQVREGITDGEHKWSAQPPRDEDGQQHLPNILNEVGYLTNAIGKVVQSVAKYEAHAVLLNNLAMTGVDFAEAKAIRHPKVAS